MLDIGFSELLLVFVIGLIVLGSERLPVTVRTVAGWIRALRSLASTVQNELSRELKLQELQDSLKKVEKASLDNLTPEFKASMDELRQAAESMKRSYHEHDPEKTSDEAHTIHIQAIEATPADPAGQANAPASAPHIQPTADAEKMAAHDVVNKADEPVQTNNASSPTRPDKADNATGKKC